MPRKTPRPEAEARAISRALRKRFIAPDAEATAKRLLSEQNVKPQEKPFSETELRRAAEILANIKNKYPTRH